MRASDAAGTEHSSPYGGKALGRVTFTADALTTHIALEAGAPYEVVPVDFGAQAQNSPEHLAVNPKEWVPAVVTESGTLTETPG